jgi:serine protease
LKQLFITLVTLLLFASLAIGQAAELSTTESWLVNLVPNHSPALLRSLLDDLKGELVDLGAYADYSLLQFQYPLNPEQVLELSDSSLFEYVERETHYKTSSRDWYLDDPLKHLQWSLRMINLEKAHALNFGADPGVVIAILDTGIAYLASGDHAGAPDLAGTIIYSGYDFVDEDNLAFDEGDGEIGHGTMLAGVVAQTTFNERGTAGIAFNASLVPVRVADSSGAASSTDLARGIRYAVVSGANIILIGVAGGQVSQAVETSLRWAWEQGVTVVAPAGNSKAVQFPASSDYTISVGGLDAAGHKAPYSPITGPIDIYAPGGDLRPGIDANGDQQVDGILAETFIGSNYQQFVSLYAEGTSLAAAHVAAVAALAYSQDRKITPTLVLEALRKGASRRGDILLLDAAGTLLRIAGVSW